MAKPANPPVNTDLPGMTLEALQAEFVRLGNEVSRLDGRRRAIDAEIRARKAKARAKSAVNKMTPEERSALREALQ